MNDAYAIGLMQVQAPTAWRAAKILAANRLSFPSDFLRAPNERKTLEKISKMGDSKHGLSKQERWEIERLLVEYPSLNETLGYGYLMELYDRVKTGFPKLKKDEQIMLALAMYNAGPTTIANIGHEKVLKILARYPEIKKEMAKIKIALENDLLSASEKRMLSKNMKKLTEEKERCPVHLETLQYVMNIFQPTPPA